MSSKMRFAVVGAGNGGLATAGDLALQGFEVRLHDKFPEVLAPVQEKGGIEMIGSYRSGFAPIHHATSDIGEAVEQADVIIVVTTAAAHDDVARSLANVVSDGQIVVLSPSYFGGSIVFKNQFQQAGVEGVDLLELRLLPYAARMVGPAAVGIKGMKEVVHCATLPASRIERVMSQLEPIFPWLRPMSSVLEVGINNTNPVGHVPITLLSLTRLENEPPTGHFNFDSWHSSASRHVTTKLDEERLMIAEAFGFPKIARENWLKMSYTKKKELHQQMGKVPESSASVPPRYIMEDVPMGLVPISDLGRQFGLPTPVCDGLIEVASAAKGIDFRKMGRTLKSLGLNGLSPSEMVERVG
ncbi:MAG TPA: NAD(P)-binding domain-containing protein [Corynebacteriales bacterium]|nr:NAD(P)-binding domain-containing protein [Mycobacteriales bacterium]